MKPAVVRLAAAAGTAFTIAVAVGGPAREMAAVGALPVASSSPAAPTPTPAPAQLAASPPAATASPVPSTSTTSAPGKRLHLNKTAKDALLALFITLVLVVCWKMLPRRRRRR